MPYDVRLQQFVAAGAICLALPGPLQATPATSPIALVNSIYKQEMGGGIDWMNRTQRPQRLTAALSRLWTTAEKRTLKGDALLDFDVAADTNGLELAGFEPKLDGQEANSATVSVTVRYKGGSEPPHVVRYTLVREGGGWKIDEIGTKSWSLRGILKPAAAAH